MLIVALDVLPSPSQPPPTMPEDVHLITSHLERTHDGVAVLSSVDCAARDRETGLPITYTDFSTYGCRVDAVLSGGAFNISVEAMARGKAYVSPKARQVDLEAGGLFDVELLPRVTGVRPAVGSEVRSVPRQFRGPAATPLPFLPPPSAF